MAAASRPPFRHITNNTRRASLLLLLLITIRLPTLERSRGLVLVVVVEVGNSEATFGEARRRLAAAAPSRPEEGLATFGIESSSGERGLRSRPDIRCRGKLRVFVIPFAKY